MYVPCKAKKCQSISVSVFGSCSRSVCLWGRCWIEDLHGNLPAMHWLIQQLADSRYISGLCENKAHETMPFNLSLCFRPMPCHSCNNTSGILVIRWILSDSKEVHLYYCCFKDQQGGIHLEWIYLKLILQ